MLILFLSWLYRNVTRPIFFLFDPELVHNFVTFQAELIGKSQTVTQLLNKLFGHKTPVLKQKAAGITFKSPLGLAAGFDYEAKLTGILPSLGFGCQTI